MEILVLLKSSPSSKKKNKTVLRDTLFQQEILRNDLKAQIENVLEQQRWLIQNLQETAVVPSQQVLAQAGERITRCCRY